MRVLLRCVAASVVFATATPARAQCDLTAVHNLDVAIGAYPLEVRVGTIDSRWSTPFSPSFANRVLGHFAQPPKQQRIKDEVVERAEAALAEALADALAGPGRPKAAGRPAGDALVLHADITVADPGNRASRVVLGTGRAVAAVRALLTSADGRPIAAVTCDRQTAGGLFGTGGLFAMGQSGESLVDGNLRKIAQSIVKQLGRSEQVAATQASRQRSDVATGELRYSSRVWLDRPAERWSLKDAASVLGNFMTLTYRWKPIGGPPVLLKGVHSLWMTPPVHQAIRRTQALLSDGEKSVWIHPFSFGLDDELLRVIEEEDGYAIAVWPWDKAPVYWNPDQIAASTFLRRTDRDGERVPPLGLLGAPWPPAIFLFPRTAPDGTPLVSSLDTTLELHTRLNGQSIVSRFELSRLGLRDVLELRAGARAIQSPQSAPPGAVAR